MKVDYVLMYGTPYLKYREFETFEDISKFLVNKSIVNYSIFKKIEGKEEVEMIYRDSDIRVLEERIEKAIEYINSCTWSNGIDKEIQYSLHVPTLLNILKGEDKDE